MLPASVGTIARSGFAGQVCASAGVPKARPRVANSRTQIGFMTGSFISLVVQAVQSAGQQSSRATKRIAFLDMSSHDGSRPIIVTFRVGPWN